MPGFNIQRKSLTDVTTAFLGHWLASKQQQADRDAWPAWLHTIIDLMVAVGRKCNTFMEIEIQGICVDDIQVDDIWQFVYCKAKTAKKKDIAGNVGDSYCFTGIERATKPLVAWHFSRRSQEDTDAFCEKLRDATAGRCHLSTDGYAP